MIHLQSHFRFHRPILTHQTLSPINTPSHQIPIFQQFTYPISLHTPHATLSSLLRRSSMSASGLSAAYIAGLNHPTCGELGARLRSVLNTTSGHQKVSATGPSLAAAIQPPPPGANKEHTPLQRQCSSSLQSVSPPTNKSIRNVQTNATFVYKLV
jgi:hypothetical protein